MDTIKYKIVKLLTDGLISTKCLNDIDPNLKSKYQREFYAIEQLAFYLVPLIENPLRNHKEENEKERLENEMQKILNHISYTEDIIPISVEEFLQKEGYLNKEIKGIFGPRQYFEI